MLINVSVQPPAPAGTLPGYYLVRVTGSFDLAGPAIWLGPLNPEAGLSALAKIAEGFYAILFQPLGSSAAREWGSFWYWGPGVWRLTSRDGRKVIVPQAPIGPRLAKAVAALDRERERGGLTCNAQS